MNRRTLLQTIGVSSVAGGTAGCLDTGPSTGDSVVSSGTSSEALATIPISISDLVPDGPIESIIQDEPPYIISTETYSVNSGIEYAVIVDQEKQEIVYPNIQFDNKYAIFERAFKHGSPVIEVGEDDNFVAAVGTYNGGVHLDQITVPSGGSRFRAAIASEEQQPSGRGSFPLKKIPELIDAMLQDREIFGVQKELDLINIDVYDKISVILALLSAYDTVEEKPRSTSEVFNSVGLKFACDHFSVQTNNELNNKMEKVVDLMVIVLAYKSGLPRDPLSKVGDELHTHNEKVEVEPLINQAKFVTQNVVEVPYKLSVEIDVSFNHQIVNYDIIRFESPTLTVKYEYARPGIDDHPDWRFLEMDTFVKVLNADVPDSVESFVVQFI